MVAQRIIVAGPLAIGPRLGLLARSLHNCLRFCGVVRRCRRSSTAAAGEATSCLLARSVLMHACRCNERLSFFCGLLLFLSRDPLPPPLPLYCLYYS